MRTALCAGLVAGSVFLHAVSAFAGEGSSLRGLKPPRDDAETAAVTPDASDPGIRWRGVSNLLDLAPRLSLYGGSGVLETRHFATQHADYSMGLYRPLGTVSPLGEGSASPLNDALPKYTLHRQVTGTIGGGFGLGFGVRPSEYNFTTTNLLSVSAEQYIGSFRGAYTLYSNRADGSSLGSAHRFQVNYFYGERNTVGLAYTTGRDLEHLGPAVGLPANDVRDLSLSGRHWLSPNWALTYEALQQEQTLYKRQGLRLGVSRSF